MKQILLATMLGLAFLGCENTAKDSGGESEKLGKVARVKNNDERILLVPGEALGKVQIGQDIADLGKLLGKPDAGDAAMGKAWGIWYDMATIEQVVKYAVYSTYKDSTMTSKVVRQIRTESARFETKNELSVSSSLAEFKKDFPSLVSAGMYYRKSKGDTVKIFDSQDEGIAIETVGAKCSAIIVHKRAEYMADSFYTIDSDWKKIQ